jgi:hypothetical protein
MSRFTEALYRQWMAQNGSVGPRRRPAGGMGGVPPMGTAASAPALGPSRGAAAANDDTYSRPEKQGCDYVDNLKN